MPAFRNVLDNLTLTAFCYCFFKRLDQKALKIFVRPVFCRSAGLLKVIRLREIIKKQA